MPQRPFSPEGVQQKMNDLYALADAALFIQADLVESDFRQWIVDNFSLDTTQTSFLNSTDDRFIAHASSASGLAIRNRLSIILIRPSIPSPASKLIEMQNDIHPFQSPTGYGVSGSLSFTVRNA
jgi:hypothetical protein